MQLQYMYTRLNVENFKACKDFYQNVLGLTTKFEDDMDEYVEFDTGSVLITLFNREKLTDFVTRDDNLSYNPHSARVVLSFKVTDMEAATRHLRTHNIEILNPPTNYPDRGIVSTCFRDPDGNLIEFEEIVDVMVT
ncbi:VOC family protein [Oscillatoria sp. CS-180]|uniref:VOC family protein n=1 Tax=Oscillatoria sp. CS-180 TaxID=3021720 RepID=UPI00232F774B|nr:VOC family protein [Oscillatoria sp. CS-180]MDB9529898.1 VOC family protein [Oscillatoria sp. CS-180]